MFEIGRIFFEVHNGKLRSTPEHRLRIAIRLINNPDGYYLGGCERDNMLLADFPSYTNSVERLVALSAFLGNECTPPEVRAKYEPERDRLRALPPESLIRVTDELEVQLDVILKAAKRDRLRARIKKVAIPAGVAVLVLAGLTVLFRHRVIHKGKGMREEAAQERH